MCSINDPCQHMIAITVQDPVCKSCHSWVVCLILVQSTSPHYEGQMFTPEGAPDAF